VIGEVTETERQLRRAPAQVLQERKALGTHLGKNTTGEVLQDPDAPPPVAHDPVAGGGGAHAGHREARLVGQPGQEPGLEVQMLVGLLRRGHLHDPPTAVLVLQKEVAVPFPGQGVQPALQPVMLPDDLGSLVGADVRSLLGADHGYLR
jgi:hypothetical protein